MRQVPTGGSAGDVLTRTNTAYTWQTPSSGGGGLTQNQVDARIQVWARTGNNSRLPEGKIPAGIARDSEVASAISSHNGSAVAHAAIRNLIPSPATATPVTSAATAAVGTSTDYARADHRHIGPAAVGLTIDQVRRIISDWAEDGNRTPKHLSLIHI